MYNTEQRRPDRIYYFFDFNYKQRDGICCFFESALCEIQEYEEVLNCCESETNFLPTDDRAFDVWKVIKYDSDLYYKFLDLLKKSVFEYQHSFVLKYLDIGGLLFASGERALLNFFSWLHFVPFFNYMTNDDKEELYDNVLLLIDEIDLYCHPLWQQKMIHYLISEIKAEYSNKKVQIIFTTHSPIVLSDMPKCNIIYLERKDGKCSISENGSHTETFGANIYKLFDDAFFLGEKGQIGEFAMKKIQDIIDKIVPDKAYNNYHLSAEEIKRLENEIDLIGEKIIREKLYDMLYQYKYTDLNSYEKQICIYKDKIKRLQTQMETENDTN